MHTLIARPDDNGPVLTDGATAPLGTGDLRLRVRSAAVNHIDVFISTTAGRELFGIADAIGLGWDVSGVVTEVGTDVAGFSVGDAVAALNTAVAASARTHAEEVVVPADAAARIPDGLDPVDAGSVPLNALTASQALDLFGPADGRTLLVTGAAGALGGYAVALGARAGWRVTGLARTTDEPFVRAAGADAFVSQVPGPAYDAVLDAAALQEGAIVAARDGGRFVGVHPPVPVPPERGIEVTEVNVRADGARLAELLELSRDGVLAVRVAGRVTLTDAATAYDKVAGGGHRGRWLLTP